MAAAESNGVECVDILRGKNAAEKTDTPCAAALPRQQDERYRFRAVDLLYYAFSLSFFFADVTTDSIVCVQYFLQGHLAWGCFATSFTILPACITQVFSLRWHHKEGSLRTVHWLLHSLLLGFLHRYLTLLYIAMHSVKSKSSFSKDKNWVYRQESDICMLYLFESFTGAAPQLILQLYIIAILHHAPLSTSASAVASFCSLIWAVSTYVKAMHNINCERNNVTWVALALQAFWRGGMLLSRIGVLVLATVILRTWFFLFLGVHWLFMTIWVIVQKTEFCSPVWEERIYNCIIGLIYCFDFFNLREGRSRYHVLAFYSVIATQNLIFLALYALLFRNTVASNILIVIETVIIGSMLIGLMSMLLYYGKFHPSRTITNGSQNIDKRSHPVTAKSVDTPKSFKLFHCGSLTSLHHSVDISPMNEEMATDKQSLLTNIAQISDSAEDGIVNYNCNSDESCVVRISIECKNPYNCANNHKEEVAVLSKDNPDDALVSSLYLNPADIDLSRKRRGIYEHDITSQLDWHAPDILSVDLNQQVISNQLGNLDTTTTSESNNSLSLDSCNKMIGAFDIIKNRGKLTTPTPFECGRIFDIEKQQRDETMSCVTSIHDYENVCPLGVARPPWCIRSWKAYTDIETYIHDDSVVRDRRRDTLTSTTGTTYSSEYSDSMFSRGISKQDDYTDTLTYDLVESKDNKSYSDNTFLAADGRNTSLYAAKPVVIDDRDGMLALDTIMEERDDLATISLNEKFPFSNPTCDCASTLVSTIDQIRQYTENSPHHVYHASETQWEVLNPKNLMTHANFAKVLFDSDLKNASTNPNNLKTPEVEKRDIDAIRELVRCCAIESVKKTPLIDAILSDSPILGNRASKFADRKSDANESDLYVEMSPLVSVENSENSLQARLTDVTANCKRSSPLAKKLPDKENLAPISSDDSTCVMCDNSNNNDRRAWTIERNDKNDKSLCSVRFNLKEKRHLFLEQVLSPFSRRSRNSGTHASSIRALNTCSDIET